MVSLRLHTPLGLWAKILRANKEAPECHRAAGKAVCSCPEADALKQLKDKGQHRCHLAAVSNALL